VVEYKVKRAKNDEAKSQMVVAEKKGGELVVAMNNRTSGLLAPTMLLQGHQDALFTAKFNPSGTAVASGGKDKLIYLWNVYGDCENFLVLKGHKESVLEIAWARDGTQIYTAAADKTGAVWDVEAGERIKQLKDHESFVNCITVSRRGEPFVLTGSDDCSAKLWDVRRRKAVHTYNNEYPVLACAFSDDSSIVFTGGIDNIIYAFDTRKNGILFRLEGHKDTITGLKLSPDGNFLLSNSMDATLRTWDVRPFVHVHSGRALSLYEGVHHDFQQLMLRCAWSHDGSKITAGSADRMVYVWDTASKNILYKLPGHSGSVNEVDFHPSEPIILSCSSDKKIYLGEIAA
jgi:Prp8 binding protein